MLRLSPAVRLQTSRSLLQLDDVANRRRTSARGAHRYVVSPETDLLRIVGMSSRQSAYRIRLSRRASATIAIFLPRRFATARAHARNGAAFGSTDRNTRHAAWTSSD